jgi:hypothetical protein
MPQPKAVPDGKETRMPPYKVRQDELKRAQAKARRRKTDLAKVVRRFISRYAAGEVQ